MNNNNKKILFLAISCFTWCFIHNVPFVVRQLIVSIVYFLFSPETFCVFMTFIIRFVPSYSLYLTLCTGNLRLCWQSGQLLHVHLNCFCSECIAPHLLDFLAYFDTYFLFSHIFVASFWTLTLNHLQIKNLCL